MADATPAIAIVGAGIAGLTAAATLRRIGLKVDIYEQAPAFAWIGAGLQLNPNAMKAMRGLGLEARIRSVGFAPEVGYNREWNTGEITYLHPMGDKIEQRFGAPDISLHRAELHAALLLINPAEIIHLGKKLAGLDQAGSGVRLTFTDGTWADADAVVGADGVHSTVLEILFGSGEPRFTGQVAYRATYRSELLGTEIDDRVKWWGPGRHIVTYKVNPRRDELYFIASTPEPDFKIELWSARGDLEQMRAAFTGFHPQARVILDACPEVRKWALVERDPLVRWSEGRIVLIGDACHPMLPYMAQGGSAAIEGRCGSGAMPRGHGPRRLFRRISPLRAKSQGPHVADFSLAPGKIPGCARHRI